MIVPKLGDGGVVAVDDGAVVEVRVVLAHDRAAKALAPVPPRGPDV
jgi:hypothetical protein